MGSQHNEVLHHPAVRRLSTAAKSQHFTFWPYLLQTCKKDLKRWYKSKIVHIVIFLLIAIVLTIIGESGLAKFSWAGLTIRILHLIGEAVSEKTLGSSIFRFMKDEEQV